MIFTFYILHYGASVEYIPFVSLATGCNHAVIICFSKLFKSYFFVIFPSGLLWVNSIICFIPLVAVLSYHASLPLKWSHAQCECWYYEATKISGHEDINQGIWTSFDFLEYRGPLYGFVCLYLLCIGLKIVCDWTCFISCMLGHICGICHTT